MQWRLARCNPMLRIWCVYEIFNTLKAGKPLIVKYGSTSFRAPAPPASSAPSRPTGAVGHPSNSFAALVPPDSSDDDADADGERGAQLRRTTSMSSVVEYREEQERDKVERLVRTPGRKR